MRPFCNTNVSWHWRNVDAHTSHIIPHMLHLTTKPYSSQNGEFNRTHQYMLEVILFEPLLPWDLTHMHCDVRWGVGAQVMREVDYAHFALNKSESQCITLWYNALPLIIFDHAFHTSSTNPNLFTNFSHNHNVHSRLQALLVNFLNIETCYSRSHVSREM